MSTKKLHALGCALLSCGLDVALKFSWHRRCCHKQGTRNQGRVRRRYQPELCETSSNWLFFLLVWFSTWSFCCLITCNMLSFYLLVQCSFSALICRSITSTNMDPAWLEHFSCYRFVLSLLASRFVHTSEKHACEEVGPEPLPRDTDGVMAAIKKTEGRSSRKAKTTLKT